MLAWVDESDENVLVLALPNGTQLGVYRDSDHAHTAIEVARVVFGQLTVTRMAEL
jgi:hypothetical protein